ncbi:hypothetical protein [Prosthecochloris sp. GSB1]|uniref:hypothetical protein n=1 Tax=Prosthecochloris sp. GSB1 TaxID=281093 RepID=UPI0012377EEE|nr:hypothetical protein [Prosthecochloris sp. GSB1]
MSGEKTSKTAAQDNEEKIFERACSQWRLGDWDSLARLDREIMRHHPDRAMLAVFAAVGCLQTDRIDEARQCILLAQDWGVDKKIFGQHIVAGVYNSLARAAAISGQEMSALGYLEKAVSTTETASDVRLLLKVRADGLLKESSQRKKGVKLRQGTKTASCPLRELYRRLGILAERIYKDGVSFIIDNEPAFNATDRFLHGKVSLGLAYHVTENTMNGLATAHRCRQFADVCKQFPDHEIETWGIYFYLKALTMLQKEGLLEKCLDEELLTDLRRRLDWRCFIDENNFDLSGKPNNFYGVAYAIALYRFQLGWEGCAPCQRLLQKIIDHFREYSGRFGFADETNGQNRYDRYSLLLIAEVAHHIREAGQKLTVEMGEWLRRSCEVVLNNLNLEGDGFPYGRSIGAYGDSSYLEILSAAAYHGLLSPVECKVAYSFSIKATRKFLDFWWDEKRQCVNLWDDGRKTDAYREKHRVLGESISLLHQHIYVHKIWEELGYSQVLSDEDFQTWIDQRPRYMLTRFSENKYSSALLTVRDGRQRFNLPLVNGDAYHNETSYYPIPFAQRLVQGVAGESFPQLTPKIRLLDGKTLMPLALFRNITLTESEKGAMLSWEHPELDVIGESHPSPDNRFSMKTNYKFESGSITRTDFLISKKNVEIESIEMVFACFSVRPFVKGNIIIFERGEIFRVEVKGFDEIEVRKAASGKYQAVEGRMNTVVCMKTRKSKLGKRSKYSVVIKYKK